MTRCPSCGSVLTAAQMDADGTLTCPCGVRAYAGYLQELDYLQQRESWLRDRVAEQAVVPDAATMRDYGIWAAPVANASPPPPPPRGRSTQVLLVALGAMMLLLAGLVFVAVAWDLVGPFGQVAFLLVAMALTAGLALALRVRVHGTAEALAVVAFGLAVITAAAAPALGALPNDWNRPDSAYAIGLSALLCVGGIGLGHLSGLRSWVWLGWLTLPVLIGCVLSLTVQFWDSAHVGATIAATTFLLSAIALAAVPARDRLERQTVAAVCALIAAGITVGLLSFSPQLGVLIVLGTFLLATVVAYEMTGRTPLVVVGWPVFGFWLALLAVVIGPSPTVAAAVAAAGVGLLFVVARWSRALAVTTAAVLWSTWLVGSVPDGEPTLVLTMAGIGLFAFALYPGGAPVAWLGALTLSIVVVAEVDDPPIAEFYTLCLAALLLVAGLLQWRAGQRRSGIVYGPAVGVALIPTAVLSWNDIWSAPSLLRFGIVMVLGVAVLLVGVKLHQQGLVIPAATAVGIAATAQIFATLDTLPRWLALGIAGTVLIIVGARIEWVRGKGRETGAWLQSLE